MILSSLPRIAHPTDRPNFTEVTIGDVTLWFSYKTVIAFHSPATGFVVSENLWSNTTGKHLGEACERMGVDRNHMRTPRMAFERRLSTLFSPVTAEA